jgi:hypothetical protein
MGNMEPVAGLTDFDMVVQDGFGLVHSGSLFAQQHGLLVDYMLLVSVLVELDIAVRETLLDRSVELVEQYG